MTISSIANNYYSGYSLTTSSTYSAYAADEQEYAQETYNISNLENALDTVSKDVTNVYQSIGSVYNYAQSAYKLSQLSLYDTLTATDDEVDLNGVTSVSSYVNRESSSEDYTSTYSSNKQVQSYASYLEDSTIGSLFDSSN